MWDPIIDREGVPCAQHPVSMQLVRMRGDLLDPIMQFTGLTDKNGKDIYEGDIVRHERYICTPSDYETGEPCGFDGNYIRVGHVTIRASTGVTLNGIQLFEPEGEHTNDMPSLKRKYNQNPRCWNEYAEIIGNIYENPELLEGGC